MRATLYDLPRLCHQPGSDCGVYTYESAAQTLPIGRHSPLLSMNWPTVPQGRKCRGGHRRHVQIQFAIWASRVAFYYPAITISSGSKSKPSALPGPLPCQI